MFRRAPLKFATIRLKSMGESMGATGYFGTD